MRQTFMSDTLPAPAGPYSHAVSAGGLAICSGQAGIRPDGSVPAEFVAQARQCFGNVLRALAEAGAAESDVAQVRVYLSSPDDFAELNTVYLEFFNSPFPARTTVYVGLPLGLHIEVDALAVTSNAVPSTAQES